MDYVIRTGMIAIGFLLILNFVCAGIWGDITEQYFNTPKETNCEYITDYYNPDGSYGGIIKQYDTTCLFLNGMKSINEMNQNITFTGNGIDTNVSIADQYLTKSKVVTIGSDYFKNLGDLSKISNKNTNYSTVTVGTKKYLDLEQRVVELEGFAHYLMVELCNKSSSYSFCIKVK